MQTPPIGLIGIGLLGSALAERMLAGGFAVAGFDLQAEALAALSRLGGTPVSSASELASRSSIMVLCLPDSRHVASVLEEFGDQLAAGKLLIDATTGDPDETSALAARLANVNRLCRCNDCRIERSNAAARQ
jgi:3-hydroxyisobutyrate dehydrogenase-like beta-hydroxyacid dehydrogenase